MLIRTSIWGSKSIVSTRIDCRWFFFISEMNLIICSRCRWSIGKNSINVSQSESIKSTVIELSDVRCLRYGYNLYIKNSENIMSPCRIVVRKLFQNKLILYTRHAPPNSDHNIIILRTNYNQKYHSGQSKQGRVWTRTFKFVLIFLNVV